MAENNNETNYLLLNSNKDFIINKRALSVASFDDLFITKVYDGTVQFNGSILEGEHYRLIGLLEGDSVALHFDSVIFKSKDVNYLDNKLKINNLSIDNLNYNLLTELVEINASIQAKNITVKMDNDLRKEYKKSDPAFTYKVEGLVSGETLNGELTRQIGEETGRYNILPGTLTAERNPNYIISYELKDLVIVQTQIWVLYVSGGVFVTFLLSVIISQALTRTSRRKRKKINK